jgi:hypothetical protein
MNYLCVPVSRCNVTVQGRLLPGQPRKRFFLSKAARPTRRPTQPHIQWVPGTVFPWVERPGRETGSLAPSSADVIFHHGVCGDNFNFICERLRVLFPQISVAHCCLFVLLSLFLVTVIHFCSEQQLHSLAKKIQNRLRACRQVSSTPSLTRVGLQHSVSECTKAFHTVGYANERRYLYCWEGIEVL